MINATTPKTLSTYRREFAQECARYEDNPAETADRFEQQLVALPSLESEGDTLRHLTYQNLGLNEETVAVLKDVRAELAHQVGDARDFFYQTLVTDGEAVYGRAVRMDDSRGLLQAYNVSLHDTPGVDEGLLLVTPVSLKTLTESADDIIRRARSTRGIDLDQPEAGWQLHQDHFPVR